MKRTKIDGVELEFDVLGTGEAALFIHGAFIADTFLPMMAEPGLAERYQRVIYHRRGYAGSSRVSGPVSVAEQAADCRALLRQLGVERAHVVGHSYGGAIALQLALDFPEEVHSLAVLEPALMVGASAEGYREALARSTERYREAGAVVAVDEFMRARWPEYRAMLDRMLPTALAQAVADAATSFECEFPGVADWRFDTMEARRISQPTLSVLGGDSDAIWSRFGEAHRWLLESLPHGEGFVLPGTTHFMLLQDSPALAEALTAFWARHPITAAPA